MGEARTDTLAVGSGLPEQCDRHRVAAVCAARQSAIVRDRRWADRPQVAGPIRRSIGVGA